MHNNFENFLELLSNSQLQEAYVCLLEDFKNPRDKLIADQLIKICTSHFIRQRGSKLNSLFNIKNSGFNPSIVFDIGAQVGTPELYTAFPFAHHVFVEPVAECLGTLNEIARNLSSAQVINCAASNMNGRTPLSITPSRQYSSIENNIGVETRDIEVRTVDSLYEDLSIKFDGPILLKIDVDGVEINVLKGSKSILNKDCVIVIEASIADKNPRFNSIVEYLSSYGFEVYDIVDALYRESDWHLWQVDLIFVKKNSPIWASKSFN